MKNIAKLCKTRAACENATFQKTLQNIIGSYLDVCKRIVAYINNFKGAGLSYRTTQQIPYIQTQCIFRHYWTQLTTIYDRHSKYENITDHAEIKVKWVVKDI